MRRVSTLLGGGTAGVQVFLYTSACSVVMDGDSLHGEISPEVPLENIQALYSSCYEHAKHSLDWRQTR